MASLNTLLQQLAPRHRAALQWFQTNKGQEIAWPKPLPDGTFLVNKAKGIHKPAGLEYAVSVRQSLNGPYADHDPTANPDGSWTYRYFQEQQDPSKRDSQFTNLALLACQRDGIPVGVMRQVKAKPQPRYLVLGLAFVTGWHEGYFQLVGPSGDRYDDFAQQIDLLEEAIHTSAPFRPSSVEDARRWVEASIVLREGQPAFRRSMLEAYERRCAISGCDVIPVLEAAHICRYMGKETNVVSNGLLLRSDLHTLYDRALIAIEPDTLRVMVSPELRHSEYERLAGQSIRLPRNPESRPSFDALLAHALFVRSIWDGSNDGDARRREQAGYERGMHS
ncbi:HNH endonuclease [Caballeronia sp. SL2Y3]|uniref:HNH endonuclease n=1 Tax=Caballeronia sp. SL2Y3 TaxID=2878151 RepID=UPI001FD5305E|nr:HNH endonuclease [Caballeronia sp. SL2Y3]